MTNWVRQLCCFPYFALNAYASSLWLDAAVVMTLMTQLQSDLEVARMHWHLRVQDHDQCLLANESVVTCMLLLVAIACRYASRAPACVCNEGDGDGYNERQRLMFNSKVIVSWWLARVRVANFASRKGVPGCSTDWHARLTIYYARALKITHL